MDRLRHLRESFNCEIALEKESNSVFCSHLDRKWQRNKKFIDEWSERCKPSAFGLAHHYYYHLILFSFFRTTMPCSCSIIAIYSYYSLRWMECIKSNNECCIITMASLIVNCSLDFTLFCIGWCVWIVGFQSKEFNVARLLAIYAAGIVIVVYVRCASHMRMLRNIIFSNPSCDNHECRYKRHDHIQLYVDCVLSC